MFYFMVTMAAASLLAAAHPRPLTPRTAHLVARYPAYEAGRSPTTLALEIILPLIMVCFVIIFVRFIYVVIFKRGYARRRQFQEGELVEAGMSEAPMPAQQGPTQERWRWRVWKSKRKAAALPAAEEPRRASIFDNKPIYPPAGASAQSSVSGAANPDVTMIGPKTAGRADEYLMAAPPTYSAWPDEATECTRMPASRPPSHYPSSPKMSASASVRSHSPGSPSQFRASPTPSAAQPLPSPNWGESYLAAPEQTVQEESSRALTPPQGTNLAAKFPGGFYNLATAPG